MAFSGMLLMSGPTGNPQSPVTNPLQVPPQASLMCLRSCPTVIQLLPVAGFQPSSLSPTIPIPVLFLNESVAQPSPTPRARHLWFWVCAQVSGYLSGYVSDHPPVVDRVALLSADPAI